MRVSDQAWDVDDPMRSRQVVLDVKTKSRNSLLDFYRSTYPSAEGWQVTTASAEHELCLVKYSAGGSTDILEVFPYRGTRVPVSPGRHLVMISRMQDAGTDPCGASLPWIDEDPCEQVPSCRDARQSADVRACISRPRQDGCMSNLTDEDADGVRHWLGRNQFEHISSVGGDTTGFGDRQDIWERNGTLIRVTGDRGQWWYDMSRAGTGSWLDVDTVAGAMGYKLTAPVERVAYIAASIDDRVFGALLAAERHSP